MTTEQTLQRISDRIMREAQSERDRIIGDARAEAEEILSRYRTEGGKEAKKLRKAHERDVRNLKNRLLAEARMGHRRMIMETEESALSEVFDETVAQLRKLDADRHERYMESAILDASSVLGKSLVAYTTKELGKMVKSAASKAGVKVDVAKETIDCIGGLVLEEKGTRKALDFTFDEALRRKRAEARAAAAAILFEGMKDENGEYFEGGKPRRKGRAKK